MSILLLIGSIIWGALCAQFLVQILSSLGLACVWLSGLLFSPVKKEITGWGFVATLSQAVFFSVLLLGGGWLASRYIGYETWNVNSIAGLIGFVISFIYCALQLPTKFMQVANYAWRPGLAERARFQAQLQNAVTRAQTSNRRHQ